MRYKCDKCGEVFEVLCVYVEPKCPKCGETRKLKPIVGAIT